MFDVAFSEMVVIAVVALIVIGPERLPKTARTLGHLFGRLQRYVNDVKADINREMELDELRKLKNEVTSAAREIETSVHKAASDFQASTREVESQLNAAAGAPAAADPLQAAPSAPSALSAQPAPAAGEPSSLAPPAPATPADAPAARDPASSPPPRQPSLPGFDQI